MNPNQGDGYRECEIDFYVNCEKERGRLWAEASRLAAEAEAARRKVDDIDRQLAGMKRT